MYVDSRNILSKIMYFSYRLGDDKVIKRILAGEFIIVALSVAVGFVIRQTIGNPVLQAFCQGYSHEFYEYLARYEGMYVSTQLNEYEKAPYFIQSSQNMTWDCSSTSVFYVFLPVFA